MSIDFDLDPLFPIFIMLHKILLTFINICTLAALHRIDYIFLLSAVRVQDLYSCN